MKKKTTIKPSAMESEADEEEQLIGSAVIDKELNQMHETKYTKILQDVEPEIEELSETREFKMTAK